jgi:murein peptide amidase A
MSALHKLFPIHLAPLPVGSDHFASAWHRLVAVLTSKKVLVGASLTVSGLAIGYLAFSFWPRTVNFSYAGGNCFTNPVLLPGLTSRQNSPSFQAKPVTSLSIAGHALYSHTTCVTPTAAPKEKAAETFQFGNAVLKKNVRIVTGSLPTVASKTNLSKPVSVKDPLVFALSQPDHVFTYQLIINDKTVPCPPNSNTVSCDLAPAGLAQSANYPFILERTFKGEPSSAVLTQSVTTVEAVQVVSASIAPNQTIYDVPAGLTLALNKPITEHMGVRLELVAGDTRRTMPITVTAEGQTLAIQFTEPLPRNNLFALSIDDLRASDGGYLTSPYLLPFFTSGGPKVLGINLGSYKVPTSPSIVLTFDSPVATNQALNNFIGLQANGSAVAATVTAEGNRVTITPAAAFPRCTPLTVTVKDGLQNVYGISGGSAWKFNSRTICQVVFSIGSSVQGRGITAYRFGNGGSTVLYVGGTHGDEKSSVYLLNTWIDQLEANPGAIPAGRTIVVIPNLNPDGYAANRRTNARSVDLNRNFPASNWKQGVTMPDGSFNANGGGSAPLSEPESAALASYVQSINLRAVLTYHATAGIVIPNGAGDSSSLAKTYDSKSNVYYSTGGGDVFQYDVTGAFEDWLYESLGIPTLVIELWTMGSNEYWSHSIAMWHMGQL